MKQLKATPKEIEEADNSLETLTWALAIILAVVPRLLAWI